MKEEKEGVPGTGRDKAALTVGSQRPIPKYEPVCMI
jgi:hypothetical protein